MGDYRWTRGRVLTLVGVAGLAFGAVLLVGYGLYQSSGMSPCGNASAVVLSSGSFNTQTRTGSESQWQHRVETETGDVYVLTSPNRPLDAGSEVQITLRCNRAGEPTTFAWYRGT